MQYCDIVEKLEDIRAVYPNQTIWELLDIFKIVVSFQDLSKCGKELKGFTFYMEGRFHIVIDLRHRDKVQQAVAWHEFGHIINDADNLIAGETYFDSQIDDDYEMRSMQRKAVLMMRNLWILLNTDIQQEQLHQCLRCRMDM